MGECDREERFFFLKNIIFIDFSLLIISCVLTYTVQTKLLQIFNDFQQNNIIIKENFLEYFRNITSGFGNPKVIFNSDQKENENKIKSILMNDLGFKGGWVGFFGYNIHEETMRPFLFKDNDLKNDITYNNIDSLWFLADRAIIFDHFEKQIMIFSLINDDIDSINIGNLLNLKVSNTKNGRKWINDMKTKFKDIFLNMQYEYFSKLSEEYLNIFQISDLPKEMIMKNIEPFMQDSHDSYINKIMKCKDFIKNGESYELCLTTKFVLKNQIQDLKILNKKFPSSFLYYLSLRNNNPAPFSMYFHIQALNLSICSSSPEEFLKIYTDNGNDYICRMKPIKGTIGRDLNDQVRDEELKKSLLNNEKERSENLMVYIFIINNISIRIWIFL